MDILTYKPLPLQKAFHRSQARFKAFIGALGSGKSTTGVIEAIDYSLLYSRSRGLIARKSYSVLKRTTQQTFWEWCPEEYIVNYNKQDHLLLLRANGGVSQIYFSDLENINKIKSMDLSYFYVDEASEISEDIFLMLIGRLRKLGHPTRGWITSNPVSKAHWIYKYFAEGRLLDSALFEGAKTTDNTYLDPKYIEALKKQDYRWQRVYVEGQWEDVTYGEKVFYEFSSEDFTKTFDFNNKFPLIRSWDFGYRFPVCLFAQSYDDTLFILGYIYKENILLEDFIKLVFARSSEFETKDILDYCDPSGIQRQDKLSKSSVDILRANGIFPRYKKIGVEESVNIIKTMLHNKRLWIHPNCPHLIDGITSGYQRDAEGKPRKDGFYEHFIDALRYIIANTNKEAKIYYFPPKKKIDPIITGGYFVGGEAFTRPKRSAFLSCESIRRRL